MAVTGLACPACCTELRTNAKFCDDCGASVSQAQSAEYKQVSVLFADVVHSMDIAATVGAERLRELMSDLLDRFSVVVERYGGTVNQFTGDGIMAIFGAPISLEDHAIRACLAALDIQKQARAFAVGVQRRDGIDLQLRVGLNSGEVIAGEVGSRQHSYTTVGDQVGMAISHSRPTNVDVRAVFSGRQLVIDSSSCAATGVSAPLIRTSRRSLRTSRFSTSRAVDSLSITPLGAATDSIR